ncbi:MAG: oligopeptide/dipeptide transporter, ATP-binding protein, partial [Ilumatobacteraceae bacterium]|nr:oligopeptide/dipeptide transporter, ATP-binding protein [Ilumatobacteraceae bacterium]
GKIVEQAETPVLFSAMRHPYTEALLRSIPRVEDPSHTRLRVIIGRPPNLLDPPPGCSFSPRCPYAQDRCRVEVPPLEQMGVGGHRFACFYPLGTRENAVALERNVAAGLPQAIALVEGRVPLGADAMPATYGSTSVWAGGEGPKSEDETSTR